AARRGARRSAGRGAGACERLGPRLDATPLGEQPRARDERERAHEPQKRRLGAADAREQARGLVAPRRAPARLVARGDASRGSGGGGGGLVRARLQEVGLRGAPRRGRLGARLDAVGGARVRPLPLVARRELLARKAPPRRLALLAGAESARQHVAPHGGRRRVDEAARRGGGGGREAARNLVKERKERRELLGLERRERAARRRLPDTVEETRIQERALGGRRLGGGEAARGSSRRRSVVVVGGVLVGARAVNDRACKRERARKELHLGAGRGGGRARGRARGLVAPLPHCRVEAALARRERGEARE